MKTRLNVWQRLGVVASVLWVIGGGLWQRSRDVSDATAIYLACTNGEPFGPSGDCSNFADSMSASMMEGSWLRVAVVAFAPVILAWALAYIALWTARWILAGRRSVG